MLLLVAVLVSFAVCVSVRLLFYLPREVVIVVTVVPVIVIVSLCVCVCQLLLALNVIKFNALPLVLAFCSTTFALNVAK